MKHKYELTFEITQVNNKEIKKIVEFEDTEIELLAQRHSFKFKKMP